MKRSIAAIGAAVVGLSGATLVAAPAQAAITPDCATSDAHTLKADPSKGEFYFDCIPQYGVGKMPLSVETPVEGPTFPEDFSLGNPDYSVNTSSVDDDEASAYLQTAISAGLGAFNNFSSGERSQTYFVDVAYPIVSAKKIAAKYLPESCTVDGASYDGAYKVSYAPISTVFQTTELAALTVDGAPGKFLVLQTPPALYLGLNFASDGGFDATSPQCSVSGDNTYFGTDSSTENQSTGWMNATNSATQLIPDSYPGNVTLIAQGVVPTITTTSKIGYGTPSLTVKAGGASTAGTVNVSVDGKASPVAAVATAGKATVAVSPTLSVGTHEIAVTYSGDTTHAAAEKSTTFVVTKAATVTGVTLSKSSAKAKSTRLTATTTVTVPGTSVTASGKVAFSVNGKVVKTVTLKNGKATGTLPAFAKKGTAKVVATYLGTSKLAKDASPTVKVTVK